MIIVIFLFIFLASAWFQFIYYNSFFFLFLYFRIISLIILIILKPYQIFFFIKIFPEINSTRMWIVAAYLNWILLIIIFKSVSSFNSSIPFIKIVLNRFQILNIIINNNLSNICLIHPINIFTRFHLLLLQ